MKKKIIKYILLINIFFILAIVYLSIFGLETDILNSQIKKKFIESGNKFDIELNKVKLTLDPMSFKVNVKTIGAKIIYQTKILELDTVKLKISLTSLIKNKIISSNLEFSTRPLLLRDLVTFIRSKNNRPELYLLERSIKNGYVVVNITLSFDKDGNVKKNYEINGTLKDGTIKLFKNYNFDKINFFLNIKDNVLSFKEVRFTTNKTNFFSDNLRVIQNKSNFFFKGDIQNKNTVLNKELFSLVSTNFGSFKFFDTNFSSKNNFSFNVGNKLKIEDLVINSEIKINDSKYETPISFKDYFPELNDSINIKNHKINTTYKKKDFTMSGYGEIKIEKKFDKIQYKISKKGDDFRLSSSTQLSELKLNNQDFLKPFFPKFNELAEVKNQQIKIDYTKDGLSVKGLGKIKLEKEFDEIDFHILKIKDKFNFDALINLEQTSFNVDFLNFKKDNKSKTQLKIKGIYNKKKELNFSEIIIKEKNNKIIIENLLLDKDNKVIKADKVDLNYIDIEDKKNEFLLQRTKKNNYEIYGSIFNANRLITDLLKSNNNDSKIFKNDINLSFDFDEVYIDEKDIVKNFMGELKIKNNKVIKANISAFFGKNENFKFTINTNDNAEKITTFYSSRAKPIVKRYKFIKGYEEGYLDFYSSKKNNISKSKLNIYDFKLQELPALTKLLTLASLQGIADTLSGEGIRFNEFEMNFTNNVGVMTIDEIYAIGPAISILMSGYIEDNKLISLRGTMVPATTINKSISSIPFFGKILVGDKIGEGVFGVSFKIKGPPKNLETTVNPIKTLTPRFIIRTLEKIKKN